MANFFSQQPRLSYAQVVLPIFRTMLVGGVLVMLALLAGFAAPGPSTLARPVVPARGPLIDSNEHPEWKQFLVQAAYKRAGELDQLRELPDSPIIIQPAAPIETPLPVPEEAAQIAKLEPTTIDNAPADPPGSIEETPGDMTVEIGEASATELPLTNLDLPMPVQRPESLKRQNESQRKIPNRRTVKVRTKPAPQPPAQPDFFSSLFGSQAPSAPQR